MSSTYVKYDPSLFVLERETTDGWVEVPAATFSYAQDYAPDTNGTLIYQSETATVSLSFWDEPDPKPLYPADHVRATYDDEVLFLGTVDTTRCAFTTDPAADNHGAMHRCDFTASLMGLYAIALAQTVCWVDTPGETALEWIRRWVTVDGWPT